MDLKETSSGSFLRHPWELSRANFFKSLLMHSGIMSSCGRILDAGSGDAFLVSQLVADVVPQPRVVCWDINYTEEDTVPDPFIKTTSLPDDTFDLVLMLDVAEHVENDREFLSDITNRVLAPSGTLLFSVPAWPFLYSAHDKKLGHYRRYTPAAARSLISDCGLSAISSGGLYHGLLAARAIQLIVEKIRPGREDAPTDALMWHGSQLSHTVITKLLQWENAFSRISGQKRLNRFPGLSWWALCKKN